MRKTFIILSMMVLAFAIVSCDNAKDTEKENADEKQKVEQTESNDEGTVITDEAKELDPEKVIDNATVAEGKDEPKKESVKTTEKTEVKADKKTMDVIKNSKVVEDEGSKKAPKKK